MSLSRFSLKNNVAVISGAGRGIGASVAATFAEAGAKVVICSRSEADLQFVSEQVKGYGSEAHYVVLDLSEPASMKHLVDEAVARFGRIDSVVNNVGGAQPASLEQTSVDALKRAFEFNVATTHALTQAALPHLLRARSSQDQAALVSSPSVITISSTYGHRVGKGLTAYGTAKAALLHWTRLAAVDLSPDIRVNGIAAGLIETSATEVAFQDPELRRKLEASTSLERLGTAEDVADGVLYLASPAASYVTGTILEIDGGIGKQRLDSA